MGYGDVVIAQRSGRAPFADGDTSRRYALEVAVAAYAERSEQLHFASRRLLRRKEHVMVLRRRLRWLQSCDEPCCSAGAQRLLELLTQRVELLTDLARGWPPLPEVFGPDTRATCSTHVAPRGDAADSASLRCEALKGHLSALRVEFETAWADADALRSRAHDAAARQYGRLEDGATAAQVTEAAAVAAGLQGSCNSQLSQLVAWQTAVAASLVSRMEVAVNSLLATEAAAGTALGEEMRRMRCLHAVKRQSYSLLVRMASEGMVASQLGDLRRRVAELQREECEVRAELAEVQSALELLDKNGSQRQQKHLRCGRVYATSTPRRAEAAGSRELAVRYDDDTVNCSERLSGPLPHVAGGTPQSARTATVELGECQRDLDALAARVHLYRRHLRSTKDQCCELQLRNDAVREELRRLHLLERVLS